MNKKAFTLIELLIVVAIIAILAAIAVPNFLEAQVRAKVSRTKADMRTVATALESYYVDHNHYPPHYPMPITKQVNPIVTSANQSLPRLTTPIAYITSVESCRDPFVQNASGGNGAGIPGAGASYEMDYVTYQCYETFTVDYSGATEDYTAWSLHSVGPDRLQDAVNWRVYNYAVNPTSDDYKKLMFDGLYDPSNGTISSGDVPRFGGEVPSVAGMLAK